MTTSARHDESTGAESRRLLLRVEEAAERLGIGRTLMYELVSRGDVSPSPSVGCGGSRPSASTSTSPGSASQCA